MAATERPLCCPEGSHGPVGSGGYVPKGEMLRIQDMDAYIVGSGQAAIVVAHDVFGIESGRTKQVCDELAQSLGVVVICPDFWKDGAAGGSACAENVAGALSPLESHLKRFALIRYVCALWNLPRFVRGIRSRTWSVVGADLHDKIVPLLRERGVQRFGLMGFCWGGWFVTRASSNDIFCCGAAVHPSLEICGMVGEDVATVCGQVQCPQMMLAAGNDKPEVKADGAAHRSYATKAFAPDCVFETFASMKHGWVNRGDLADANIAQEYNRAMQLLKDFYLKHLCKRDEREQ